MSEEEMAGMELFDGKGNCNSCHVDGRGTTSTVLNPGFNPDHSKAAATTPKFTCFGSANEGLPLNPRDAIYYQNTPDSFGFTANPDGFGFRDLGMGSFLRGVAAPNPNSDWTPLAPTTDGQFQVSSARNVAITPTGIRFRVRARRVTRQRPQILHFRGKVMGALPQLRHFRPADRTSAAWLRSPVRLFLSPNRLGVACGPQAPVNV